MLNALDKITKATINVTNNTVTAFSNSVAKELVSLNKFVEKKGKEVKVRIGMNHFQDHLYEKAEARGESIKATWLGSPDVISATLKGKNRTEREAAYRTLYRNGLIEFNNEESKLFFCGVYDVCDIWLESVYI